MSPTLRAYQVAAVDLIRDAFRGGHRRVLLASPTGSGKTIITIIDRFGVTATPERLDGKGLGNLFDELVIGPSVKELIELEFLAPAVTYAPAAAPDLSGVRIRAGDYAVEELDRAMSDGRLIGDAVEHYARLCPGERALVYCVSIAHSEFVAQRFRNAGFHARHLDGDTPKDERRDAVAALAAGNLDLVINCGLFSEGVDVPSLGAVILLRPTKSLALYLQMVGRALRPALGKERALILDHAGNSWAHGLYDFDRSWSLEGNAKRRGGRVPVRRCPKCGALIPSSATSCSECRAVFEGQSRTPEEDIGELEEVSCVSLDLRTMPYREVLAWTGGDSERLRLAAAARGYKPGWIWHVWRTTPREVGP